MNLKKITCLGLIFTSSSLFAANNGIYQNNFSVRSQGMGGAALSLTDGPEALLNNPAALAFFERGYIRTDIVRAGLSMGDSSFLTLMEDIQDAGDADDEVTAMSEAIEKQYGRNFHARLGGPNFSWVRPNMGFSFNPLSFSMNIAAYQEIGPALEITAVNDSTFAFGYARKFDSLLENLSIGATVKAIHRVYFSEIYPAVELAENSDMLRPEDAKEGWGVDFDLGAMYQLPIELDEIKTYASFVIRNVLNMGFGNNLHLLDDNSGEPPKYGRRFGVGVRADFPTYYKMSPRVMFDVRDIGDDHWTFTKGLHLGGELEFEGWYLLNGAVRFGYNQGYLTFGLGVHFLVIDIEFASYGEEIGTSSAKFENRVNMIRLGMTF